MSPTKLIEEQEHCGKCFPGRGLAKARSRGRSVLGHLMNTSGERKRLERPQGASPRPPLGLVRALGFTEGEVGDTERSHVRTNKRIIREAGSLVGKILFKSLDEKGQLLS